MLVGAMLYELRFEAREIVNLPILNLLSHLVVLYVYIYAHPKFKIDAKKKSWFGKCISWLCRVSMLNFGVVGYIVVWHSPNVQTWVELQLLHHMVFFPQPSAEKDLNSASRVSRASACAIAWCWPIGRNGIWQRCCNVMEWMQRYQGSGNINQQILQRKYQSKVHMQVHQWSTCVLTVCVLLIFVGNCVAISDAESSKPTHQSDWVKFCSSITTWRRSSGLNAFLHKRPRWLGRLQYVHEAHENCLSISL